MQCLSERANTCLRMTLGVAVALASLAPQAVHAAPMSPPKEAVEHYERGVSERDAKRFSAAATEFTAAYADMPPSLKDLRVGILFDIVYARRDAYASGGRIRGNEHPAAHLCAADEALTEFIDAAGSPKKGKKNGDVTRAIDVRAEIRGDLEKAREATPELDCATVEYPREDAATEPAQNEGKAELTTKRSPRAPRPIDKPLVIAGGVLTGVGLAMIGLMAGGLVRGKRAEADGDALVAARPTTPETDPRLQEIDRDGKVGNRMAIAGGVISAVALGTGVALLVVGLRGGRQSKVAVTPTMTPRGLGLALRWQF
jgi:hypothetical protein